MKQAGTSPVALKKDTSNLFRYRTQKADVRLDVRSFNHVITVDAEKNVAEVEGMTPYEELVKETLKHNRMPAVVPELKSITIGGATTGVGIESSSFKHGLVHETILEMEILLSDSRIVTASPTNEHKDLFFGFANSYGTLGYALKLKVKLIPVKPYVELHHKQYDNAQSYFKDINNICKTQTIDFVDGTIFSENEMYITVGTFNEQAPYVSDYKGRYIYYKSIAKKEIDYVTTSDYIWRWDTDWFWCSKHFLVQNPLVRFFWPQQKLRSTTYWKIRKWAHDSTLAKALLVFQKKQESIVQDVEVPIDHAPEFIEFFHKEIGIKPVWVCPTQICNKDVHYTLFPMKTDTLYINFGFWDVIKSDKPDGYYNKKIEQKVRELNGTKSLYSTSYYSSDVFWMLYNKEEYEKLKNRYDPMHRLNDLYAKCVLKK